MGEPAEQNALRRKAHVGHRAREAEGLSPTRALRLALARAAGDLWELPLTVNSVRHELIAFEDIQGRFSDTDLMMVLDGPAGICGGASVDRHLLTSVTEVQTIGEVTKREPTDRTLTPTDAALFSPLVDTMLERLDITLTGAPRGVPAAQDVTAAWLLGYRFGAMVENTRALGLALEGQDFHYLEFDIDVAAGLRRGRLILCLPDREPAPVEPPPKPPEGEGEHADSLALVCAELTATMPKLTLSVADAAELKEGDILPLDQQGLFRVELRSADGQLLAKCRLGQVAGARAVRLQARGARIDAVASTTGLTEEFVPALPELADTAAPGNGPSADAHGAPPEMGASTSSDEELPDLPPLDFEEGAGGAEDPQLGNASFE